MKLPVADDAWRVAGAAAGAFVAGGGLDRLQLDVLTTIGAVLAGTDAEARPIEPLTVAEFEAMADDDLRHQAVRLMAVLEMVAHPLSAAAARSVRQYAARLGVHSSVLDSATLKAHHLGALMYADLQRSSWYTRATLQGVRHGQLIELLESKLTYSGLGTADRVARKWLALADLEPGTWGRGVAEFYAAHSFPFPGTPHGIYEIGAKHDFVHVLTDYGATPEGELDVFGFIAASMPDEDGMVLLAVTMGLFQNGSIHRVAGKRVKMFRTDTLSDDGAVQRFADALRRGSLTTVDVMGGIDHFAHAARLLDEVRAEFNIVPVRDFGDERPADLQADRQPG